MSATARRPVDAGYLYAGITILIWASFVIVSRIGGKGSLTPFDITALRLGTAALVLSPWWLPRLLRPVLRRLKWRQSLSFALLAGVIYPLLAYSGFALAPASHGAVLISGLLPFFMTVLSLVLLGERPSRARLLGLALIAGGVFALARDSFHGGIAGPHGPVWLGDLLFVGASLVWALFTALLKRWNVRAFDVTLGVTAVGLLLYFPVYLALLPKQILQAPLPEILLQAFFQGVIVVCCAMLTYARAAELLGGARVAVLMSTVPAVGALLAVPLLNEPLSQAAATGVALVSVGALIGALARAPASAVQGQGARDA